MKPKKSTKPPIDPGLSIPPVSNAEPPEKAQPNVAAALNRLSQLTPEEQAAALFESMMKPEGKKKSKP